MRKPLTPKAMMKRGAQFKAIPFMLLKLKKLSLVILTYATMMTSSMIIPLLIKKSFTFIFFLSIPTSSFG